MPPTMTLTASADHYARLTSCDECGESVPVGDTRHCERCDGYEVLCPNCGCDYCREDDDGH